MIAANVDTEAASTATARLYDIRPGVAADHAWVYDSWLRATDETALARSMRHSVFAAGQRRVIASLLARPKCALRVACDPASPSTILGWALIEARADGVGLLHFVHVKSILRGHGVARELVAPAIGPRMRFSAKTLAFERWARAHSGWEYSPFEAWIGGGS